VAQLLSRPFHQEINEALGNVTKMVGIFFGEFCQELIMIIEMQ
jgi:hypothetical protein